ncbi:type VI secretion system Vgr family protein [Massilia sp. TS11]|uniref:type VI secretion system Vgr family protein n=1 Tax=Massilia sp. TS11 TaxID=2908003 RepID=UPI001EDBE983|nr:type VI secretion system Vgr family protein [Massilia sp. TS11]MCG2586845.1 type VI secretion system tip protein VgrG [Massilia sp. TS11]
MGTHSIEALAHALSIFSEAAQDNRLLRLTFPRGDGPSAVLLPQTLSAHEEISRCFRYECELLSDDARIPLKALMGRMATISLVREDGSLRHFNGYVTEFQFLRADGGFAFYRMVLEPWLALARLRKDNVSFLGKTVRTITEETFAHYAQADWKMRLVDEDARISCANQYNETDYNHLHRRWEARGWYYWYEHRIDGHTLMLADQSLLSNAIETDDDCCTIEFRDASGAAEADGIRAWSALRRLGPGAVTLASIDYKNPVSQWAEYAAQSDQGDVYQHAVYADAGADGFKTHDEGRRRAQQDMEALEKDRQFFQAQSNHRNLTPGRSFKLGRHFSGEQRSYQPGEAARPSIAERDYLIIAIDHEVSNNYQTGAGERALYDNSFICARKDIRWRPGLHYNSEPAIYMGIQTAVVVGPEGAQIHTDELGRIKIQFHWDRLGQHNQNSSPWIRVMSPAAGSAFGQIRLPRVGEEVAVMFMNGNIDHPIVIGALYNADKLPPWPLPHTAPLSGIRSRELHGGRHNHVLFDDTPAQIGAQLNSDHADSALNLGYLTTPRSEREALPRGEGAELRSEASIALRAKQGMLISAWKNLSRKQMDRQACLNLMEECLELFRSLGDYAGEHGAVANQLEDQRKLYNSCKAWENGSNVAPKGEGGGKPMIAISAPDGISITSQQSLVSYAARSIDTVAQYHLQFAAGQKYALNAGQGISMFAHSGGLKAIAHHGELILQSQADDTRINSAKSLYLTASDGRLRAMAKTIEIIAEDGSFIKVGDGGITLGSNHELQFKAPGFRFTDAATLAAELPTFTGQRAQRRIATYFDDSGEAVPDDLRPNPAPNRSLYLTFSDGSTEKIETDDQAQSQLIERDCALSIVCTHTRSNED